MPAHHLSGNFQETGPKKIEDIILERRLWYYIYVVRHSLSATIHKLDFKFLVALRLSLPVVGHCDTASQLDIQ